MLFCRPFCKIFQVGLMTLQPTLSGWVDRKRRLASESAGRPWSWCPTILPQAVWPRDCWLRPPPLLQNSWHNPVRVVEDSTSSSDGHIRKLSAGWRNPYGCGCEYPLPVHTHSRRLFFLFKIFYPTSYIFNVLISFDSGLPFNLPASFLAQFLSQRLKYWTHAGYIISQPRGATRSPREHALP